MPDRLDYQIKIREALAEFRFSGYGCYDIDEIIADQTLDLAYALADHIAQASGGLQVRVSVDKDALEKLIPYAGHLRNSVDGEFCCFPADFEDSQREFDGFVANLRTEELS